MFYKSAFKKEIKPKTKEEEEELKKIKEMIADMYISEAMSELAR